VPTTEFGGSLGFSRVTIAQTSTADCLPLNTLSNPFPGGLIKPTGAAGGLATQAGDAVTVNDPTRRLPYMWQFCSGFQYELIAGLLVEASYMGRRTRQLQVSKDMNYLTIDQLNLGTPYLSQVVPNPFLGVLPSNTSRGAQSTTQRRNLQAQYPRFSGVTLGAQSLGKSWCNAFQLKVEKRLSHGLSVLVAEPRLEGHQPEGRQVGGLALQGLLVGATPERPVGLGVDVGGIQDGPRPADDLVLPQPGFDRVLRSLATGIVKRRGSEFQHEFVGRLHFW
jgi:hypothetical protein